MLGLGRVRRYRERIQFEMHSVHAKSLRGLVVRTLQKDFGRSRLEAESLAERSLIWLQALGMTAAPGQVRLSVPAGPSRRCARARRRSATVTAVDVGADTEIWEQHGLEAMQRGRLVRWLYEIYRQGGWASLAEVAAWANLTPTALGHRLEPVRRLGIWLPHVGGRGATPDALALEPWLIAHYLSEGHVESHRALLGLTVGAWEAMLRRFVRVTEAAEAGTDPDAVAAEVGLSPLEVQQMQEIAERYRRRRVLRELRASYGWQGAVCGDPAGGMEAELMQAYRFSPVAARLYHHWLVELAARLHTGALAEGELIFFAISADEGARAELAEARHVPVRLRWFTAEDAAVGPYGENPTRVAELKFGRLVRYATEARAQGALLTLPDLAVLMGISVDAVRRHLATHTEVVVPTRGRVKDIGRGVTHRARIVELYLQMHTETEIVDRTGHTYESVEAYLREFARVVALADQGLNAVMIRRVTGRSMALVKAYLDLYQRYDQPDYHFRLAQLRQVFTQDELLGGKKGRRFRSRTAAAAR